MRYCFLLLTILLAGGALLRAQAPGSGWATVPTPERTVKKLYWQLFDKTEVWIRVVPTAKDGRPIPVSLILFAILPGNIKLPVTPQHAPKEITLLAQPSPLAFLPTPGPTLRLTTERGVDLDLMRLGMAGVPSPCDGCANQPIRAVVDVATFDALMSGEKIQGNIWGLSCELTTNDTDAIREFGRAVGLYR